MTIPEAPFAAEAPFVQKVATDPQAFIGLYDVYFARVYNYVRYRCVDPDVSDDLTAIIFEQALYKIASYSPARAPFGAWLFGIARNIVNDFLRAQKRKSCISLDEFNEPPGRDPSPEEAMIHAEAQDELILALQKVSERERDLLSLKFAARLTNRRIAEITGLTESNVGIILYRTLHKLREVLDVEVNSHG